MLLESLKDWKHYDFGPTWSEVMTWAEANCPGIENGEYTIADCTARVTDAITRVWGEARYECHRRMADVQIVLHGEEDVYNLPLHTMRVPDVFDEGRDLGFFNDEARLSPFRLMPGLFALLLPWDAHMPLMAVAEKPMMVRKMIIKIPVERLYL